MHVFVLRVAQRFSGTIFGFSQLRDGTSNPGNPTITVVSIEGDADIEFYVRQASARSDDAAHAIFILLVLNAGR